MSICCSRQPVLDLVEVISDGQRRGAGRVVKYTHRGHALTGTVALVRFKLKPSQHISETQALVVDNLTKQAHIVPWFVRCCSLCSNDVLGVPIRDVLGPISTIMTSKASPACRTLSFPAR